MKAIILSVLMAISLLSYSQPKPKAKYDTSIEAYKQRRYNDSLEIQYLNYKIERARYYLKIVNRKRSQQKFLLGWMNRALK